MKRVNGLDYIAQILLIVGGLNWGLIALFDYNFVASLFGETVVAQIVYGLVGLSAVYAIYTVSKLASPREYRMA
jgi:uncharacterized membrane protein YuzA (DUF378 family)